MCFKFDAWCCFGPGPGHEDDYYGSSAKDAVPAKMTTPHYPPQTAQRNGHQGFVAHHANGHRAPHHHDHHHQLPVAAAADEEDRKASNDARKRHAPAAGAAAMKGAHVYAAGAQYVYSGADGTLKHPATKTRIADGAGHGAHYYEREPAHSEEYYHYR